MFSCSNYERGCRGRCDLAGGKCRDCSMYNLRHCPHSTESPFNYKSKLSSPVNLRSVSNSPLSTRSLYSAQSQRQDPSLQDGLDR